jgi:hypothetical protein
VMGIICPLLEIGSTVWPKTGGPSTCDSPELLNDPFLDTTNKYHNSF